MRFYKKIVCLSHDFFLYNFAKMVNKNLEAQKQTIKHYWLNVTHSLKEIQELTNIPLCIIKHNIKKLKENSSIEHKRENERPTKVTQNMIRAIGQNLRRNNAIST